MSTNYEIKMVAIPRTKKEAEGLEKWLERGSEAGAELVCFMPSLKADSVLAVFTVGEKGKLSSEEFLS